MIRTSKNAVLTSLSVLALACGGGNGGKSRSGVDPSKALGDATSQDVDKLCSWFNDNARVVPTGEQICKYEAVLNSESQSECKDLAQSCIEDGDLTGSDGNAACPFDEESLADCDASIADLEDCLSRASSITRRIFNSVSCDNPSVVDDFESPASCERIVDRCPNVFTTSGGGNIDGDKYICRDGTEIRSDFFCDGFDDCAGGEDERCSGGDGDDGDSGDGADGGFVCQSGNDIDDSYLCDGYQDCADGEDELKCGDDPTPGGQFECNDGKNIAKDFVCDGTRDCDDGEDEATCDGGFICKDGFDISDQWKCDDTADCDGGEDELDC